MEYSNEVDHGGLNDILKIQVGRVTKKD